MYDSAGHQSVCSDRSPLSEDMKYYSCLVDKVRGMQACGLEAKESDHHLEPQLANRTVKVENVKKTEGSACYFNIRTNSSWVEGSTVNIYPSRVSRVDSWLIAGETRGGARTT